MIEILLSGIVLGLISYNFGWIIRNYIFTVPTW